MWNMVEILFSDVRPNLPLFLSHAVCCITNKVSAFSVSGRAFPFISRVNTSNASNSIRLPMRDYINRSGVCVRVWRWEILFTAYQRLLDSEVLQVLLVLVFNIYHTWTRGSFQCVFSRSCIILTIMNLSMSLLNSCLDCFYWFLFSRSFSKTLLL